MDERRLVERWFLKQGLPHLIDGYSASGDVFTRALPFLLLVFLFNVAGAFSDRFTGWGQAGIALASLAIVVSLGAAVNVVRGRRPLQVPERVGLVELTVFAVAPAVPPLLFSTEPVLGALGVIGLNIMVLLTVYLIVGFGLVPTTVWAMGQTYRHVSQLLTLMGRALPFVLVFSAFLFLNAELWQVALDFTPLAFWITIGLLVSVAVSFIALRIPREIAEIAQFRSWQRVCDMAALSDSPLEHREASVLQGPCDPPLTRADRFNVLLVVLFNLGLQVGLVSVVIGIFYTVFGTFAVRANTIVNWTSLTDIEQAETLFSFELFGTDLVLTVVLMRVVGFLVAFSALQFSVSAVTDPSYRQEFFEEVTGEVRQALAVRSIYLDQLTESRNPSASTDV